MADTTRRALFGLLAAAPVAIAAGSVSPAKGSPASLRGKTVNALIHRRPSVYQGTGKRFRLLSWSSAEGPDGRDIARETIHAG